MPEGWGTSRLGHLIHILSGFAFPSTGFSLDENDTKLLRGVNVGVSEIKWDDVVYWKRAKNDGLDIYELDVGKIVIGMDRPLISTGIRISRITYDDIPSLLLQRVTAITTLGKICEDFLFRVLTSGAFASSFESEMTGVSVPHISPSQISGFIVPIPPLAEQTQIAAFLDHETTKIDTLITKAESAIQLLQERRTALISAAVTGKIDVRGFVKN